MNSQKLVTLAACASKSSQEAKRAEAHARASRVYAKKAEKDAKEAQIAASRLLQFAKDLLLRMFHSNEEIGVHVSREDLEALIKIANLSDPNIDASTLLAVLNFEKSNLENNEESQKLLLKDEQIQAIEKEIGKTNISESCSDSESDANDKTYPAPAQPEATTAGSQEDSHHLVANPLNFSLPPINVASKRKLKHQKKIRARGIISPLLSKEEISIVKRSTSPSTSQHSGLNPHLGTQHKYSVRMKHSTSSLHSAADDEERTTSAQPCARDQDSDAAPDRPFSAKQ